MTPNGGGELETSPLLQFILDIGYVPPPYRRQKIVGGDHQNRCPNVGGVTKKGCENVGGGSPERVASQKNQGGGVMRQKCRGGVHQNRCENVGGGGQ